MVTSEDMMVFQQLDDQSKAMFGALAILLLVGTGTFLALDWIKNRFKR